MRQPDFDRTVTEPWFNTENVQDFLDWFENMDWSGLDEDDRELIERARKLKELVTGEGVSNETFERDGCTVIRDNAFTDYIKQEEIDLNESAWKSIPRVWQDNINWSEVASDLRSDYAEIEWEGNTYLFEVND